MFEAEEKPSVTAHSRAEKALSQGGREGLCRAFLLRIVAGKPVATGCSPQLSPPLCTQLFPTLLPRAVGEARSTSHLLPPYSQRCPHPVLKEAVSPHALLRQCVFHLLGK